MKKEKVDVSQNAYKQDKLGKIPSWLKILFLKYWVAGAAFYFFGMGGAMLWYKEAKDASSAADVLAAMNATTFYLWLVLGAGLGFFNEFITKTIVRFMRTNADDTYRFNLINLKGSKSLFLNLFYALGVVFLTMVIEVNILIPHKLVFDPLKMTDEGIEPFSYALLFIILDYIFIGIKNLIIYIYKRQRYHINLKRQQQLLNEDDVPVYGDDIANNEAIDNFLNDETEENK